MEERKEVVGRSRREREEADRQNLALQEAIRRQLAQVSNQLMINHSPVSVGRTQQQN